jgi:hypothetical protein
MLPIKKSNTYTNRKVITKLNLDIIKIYFLTIKIRACLVLPWTNDQTWVQVQTSLGGENSAPRRQKMFRSTQKWYGIFQALFPPGKW